MDALVQQINAEAEIQRRRVIKRDGGTIDINRHASGTVTLGCKAPGCTLVVHLDPGQAREVGETLAAFDAETGTGSPKVSRALAFLRALEMTQREARTLRGMLPELAEEPDNV